MYTIQASMLAKTHTDFRGLSVNWDGVPFRLSPEAQALDEADTWQAILTGKPVTRMF